MSKKWFLIPVPVGIVLAVVVIIFGMYFAILNWSNMEQNSKFIESADMVVAECIPKEVIDDDPKAYLKTAIKYVYNGKTYDNVLIDNYGQLILPGYKVNLFVNPDDPTQCAIAYKYTEGTGKTMTFYSLAGLGGGIFMIIILIYRIRRGYIWYKT